MNQPNPILQEIDRLTKGLLFISESEAPVESIAFGATPDLRHRLIGMEATFDNRLLPDTPFREQSLDDVFGDRPHPPVGAGNLDVKQAPAYRALLDLMKTQLSNARVYRLGGIPATLYIIGQTPDGGWVGVRTTTVET